MQWHKVYYCCYHNNKQIHKLMKYKFLLLFLIIPQILSQQSITASLMLVQYEPFVFKLTFSEAVTQPAFQLLLNGVYPLNYTFLTDTQPANTYFFQVAPFDFPVGARLENYGIIFNNPMKIGGGRLDSGSFMLTASKVTVQIDFSQTLGLLAILAAYIMINFTFLGLALIEFLQVYCLLMFRNEMKTTLYHEMSRDLLLLNPVLTDGTYFSTSTLAAILLAPIILVLIAGSIGFLVKRCAKKTDSIIQKIAYQTLVYNFFITVSTTFLFPLFYNSIQFYTLCKSGAIDPESSLAKWGSFISYLSIVTTFAIVYLFLYVINPKANESEISWKKYLKTQQFLNFRKLHQTVWWEPWHKRNKNVFIIMKRLLIAGLFFWDDGFEIMVFLLEFINIFYIFTADPFKYTIYTNSSVVTRLLMFLFYGFILVGNLYYSLGSITINYQSVKTYLSVRDVIFLIIILSIFLFIFYEIYNKCSNLNYQIRLVKEENQYRLKITEKEKMDNEQTTHRKHINSLGESQDHSYNRNTRFTTFDNSKLTESTPRKLRDGSLEKRVSMKNRVSKKFKEQDMKGSLPVHLEVDELDRERAASYVNSEGKKSKERKNRHKWKKESLLAQILKEN